MMSRIDIEAVGPNESWNYVIRGFKQYILFCDSSLAYINGYEDDLVDFLVTPSMIRFYLWGNYTYGFYYTAKNQPVIIFNGDDCDTDTEIEIYDIIFRGNHWYRTEKIDDNWYFYEDKVKY